MTNDIPFISDEQVKELLPMNEAIELMNKAFIQITKKNRDNPPKIKPGYARGEC